MSTNISNWISRKPLDVGANFCLKVTSHALQGASMLAGAVGVAHLSLLADCQLNEQTCVDLYFGEHSVTDWTAGADYSKAFQAAGAVASFAAAKALHVAAKTVAAWEVGKKVEVLPAQVKAFKEE